MSQNIQTQANSLKSLHTGELSLRLLGAISNIAGGVFPTIQLTQHGEPVSRKTKRS